jgi:hypothetical protein
MASRFPYNHELVMPKAPPQTGRRSLLGRSTQHHSPIDPPGEAIATTRYREDVAVSSYPRPYDHRRTSQRHYPTGSPPAITTHSDSKDIQYREDEVEYVLAKSYKSIQSGTKLGFPAFSVSLELLGFYRESLSYSGMSNFVPLSQHAHEFGPLERMQARDVVHEEMERRSRAVLRLRDWGSIKNLIDHALVYDWSKDVGDGTGNSDDVSEGGADNRQLWDKK